MRNRKTVLIFSSLLVVGLALHVFLGRSVIRTFSPTYDEPVHLTAGFIYWKTGLTTFNGLHHPPFAELWAAIPLMFTKAILPTQDPDWIRQVWDAYAQYRFADRFLFHNRLSTEELMGLGRWMQLFLSCVFLLLLALVGTREKGMEGGLLSFFLGCFSVTWLAHGSLVSTDLAFSVFFFLFFAWLPNIKTASRAALGGILLGLCAASKFSFVLILPSVLALLIWKSRPRYLGGAQPGWNFSLLGQKTLPHTLIVMGVAILTVGFIYHFTEWSVFFKGLHAFFMRTQTGRSSYFMGRHSTEGWLAYFPVLFLMKTEIPLLLALVLALVLVVLKKASFPSWIWIPPVVFFLAACFSKVQIGHRYILAVYPFVFVLGSLATMSLSARLRNWVAGVLVIAMGIIAFWTRPYFLGYFNELVGGSIGGGRCFTDSNLDWGQDLKLLRDQLEPEDLKNGIYLSYFGVVDPHHYDLKYWDVGSNQIVNRQDNSLDPTCHPTKLVISLTNLKATYYQDPEVFLWLNTYHPWKIIGTSLWIYDFENHPEAIKKLDSIRGGF